MRLVFAQPTDPLCVCMCACVCVCVCACVCVCVCVCVCGRRQLSSRFEDVGARFGTQVRVHLTSTAAI